MPNKISESVSLNPNNYYQGIEFVDRIITKNVLVFERRTKKQLQQKQLSNRMHHRFVFIRPLQTEGIVNVDGKSLALKKGDALLVAPYQFHHYTHLEADHLHWLFITFELEKGNKRLEELNYRILKTTHTTNSLWTQITESWLGKERELKMEILPLLDQLLTKLYLNNKFTTGNEQPVIAAKNEWFMQVEQLIFQSIKERWTLEEVARKVGISDRHLRNRFEAQMGMTLRDYKNNYQLHIAVSLMRNPGLSLSHIAEMSGFNSQPVFNHFIKRISKRTPSELRKEVLSENPFELKSDDNSTSAF